jgi:pyruvate formate lyase activating enzyme
MQGFYHSVETFGTVDGPGIRFVLFLAGCSLRCKFCHNPDTWQRGSQQITVEQALARYQQYRQFYDAAGGGITISGGEPLLQPDFLRELLVKCREQSINTIIDTGGYYPQANLTQVLSLVDALQFSLKAAEPGKHRWLTGCDNTEIISNLRYAAAHVPVTLRYVVIPGVNNCEADLELLADLVTALPRPVTVELLAYHTMGQKKWEALGWQYQLADVPQASPADVAAAHKYLEQLGVTVR